MAKVVKLPTSRQGCGRKAEVPLVDGNIIGIDEALANYAQVQRYWADFLRDAFQDRTLDSGDVEDLIAQLDATAKNLAYFSVWLRHNWPE